MNSQTVSVYRKGQPRRVAEGCHFEWKTEQVVDPLGRRQQTKCLLLIPGGFDIAPGDRVLEGIGPEEVDWEQFVPVKVPGVAEIGYVQAYGIDGAVHHMEAGRK